MTNMGNIEAALLNERCINAIPVDMPEVVPALGSGTADTFIAPAARALGIQEHQYINDYIKTPYLQLTDKYRDE